LNYVAKQSIEKLVLIHLYRLRKFQTIVRWNCG